ncbi:cytochrome c oxidase assembly protein [Microbacterium sp. ARD32]|uniref:cytochrome c oxidase assembly protein n=1 Tax=Microbacterium sp. ARD32 TaxID=2962577 RepID=UPI002882C7D8|nr:cytochrome c oxidase assembly protein [Microbacterium sp. ARD32]MDT0157914.1 cytochrome c oxidase assembly protein [Microbacterium sp. ARD32]
MKSYRLAGLVILLVGATAGLLAALAVGGGAVPPKLLDPGPVVMWGLPAVKLVANLAGAVMLGSLVLALFGLRSGSRPFERALDAASVGAAIFTVTSALAAGMTLLAAFNPKLSADRSFGEQLGMFLLTLELGQAWLITVLMGALITLLTFAVRGWTGTLITGVLAAASFLPLATQGHSGAAEGHNIAVNAILMHTLGAAVWIGGLFLLVVLRGTVGKRNPGRGKGGAWADALDMPVLVARYSSLALIAFIVVAVSGVSRTVVALGEWSELFSPYGLIVIGKAILLLGLGLFGAWYRRRLIPALSGERERRSFWTLVLGELALMGAASGAAAALARTPPPFGEEDPVNPTAAQRLTDSPLPPELTLDRWFTSYDFDILWMVVIGFAMFFYIAGVVRLRRRGDAWPVQRTVFWMLGMLLLLWVTSGPLNLYQEYLFSVHMAGHMVLSMAIPLLLVSGAPITLALRAVHKREDGTRGAREWIMWAVHSPFSRVITHPIVAAAIFVVSLWAFYFTDLVRWAMYDHVGHEWMVIHFLISGYLLVMSLVGIDPVPYRMPYAGRLITLIAVMAMHAFFGMAIMMQSGLMVAEWFGSMGRTWGPTPMEDQYIGGGIAWSVGEIPTLILAITVAIQWSRSDERLQRRRDRHADRTGDAELEEYNARLAKLAERDRAGADRA